MASRLYCPECGAVQWYSTIRLPSYHHLEYLSIILHPASDVSLRHSLASPAWQVNLNTLYILLALDNFDPAEPEPNFGSGSRTDP